MNTKIYGWIKYILFEGRGGGVELGGGIWEIKFYDIIFKKIKIPLIFVKFKEEEKLFLLERDIFGEVSQLHN